jgi:hypothetical protein
MFNIKLFFLLVLGWLILSNFYTKYRKTLLRPLILLAMNFDHKEKFLIGSDDDTDKKTINQSVKQKISSSGKSTLDAQKKNILVQ